MYKKISNIDLEIFCREAIKKGLSRNAAEMELRSVGTSVGRRRLKKIWEECGGEIQPRYKDWAK